jgi:hypothetical protein
LILGKERKERRKGGNWKKQDYFFPTSKKTVTFEAYEYLKIKIFIIIKYKIKYLKVKKYGIN